MTRGVLSQWVIYNSPRDYPGKFVVRRWEIRPGIPIPTSDVGTADTLEEIRRMIPSGLYRLPRFDEDEPQIVEVWI